MNSAGFRAGFSYLGTGWRLIRQPGLKRFVVLPLLVNIVVFLGLGWLLFGQFEQWLGSIGWLDKHGDWWIVSALATVFKWVAGLVLLFALSYAFTLLANVVGAPFNGLLAEKVEAHLSGEPLGNESGSVFWALLKSVPGTLVSEIGKLLYLALWMVLLFLLHFIPVINFVAPFLLFLFGAWMIAVEYIDYPMGNDGHRFKTVRQTLRKNRRMALGFGLPVSVLVMVPVVNLFIMPIAVAGATALYFERLKP